MSYTPYKTYFILSFAFTLSSAYAFNLDQSKILSFGKEFRANFQYYLRLVQIQSIALDEKNVTQELTFSLEREGNVGKGKNAGNHHFLFLGQCF